MFQLEINTDNAAFEDSPNEEVARLLRLVAELISKSGKSVSGTIRDINGNRVGFYDLDTEI